MSGPAPKPDTRWYTAAEIAALALPGLPGTERNIRRRAAAENWPYRERQGRGGGREYPATALPLDARAELGRRATAAATPARLPAPGPAAPPVLQTAATTAKARDRQDYKLAILAAWDAFRVAGQGGVSALRHKFVGFYNAGEIGIEPWVRAQCRTISPSSLHRWEAARAGGDMTRLAGRYGNRAGSGVLDRAAVDVMGWMIATITDTPNMGVEQLRTLAVGRFGDRLEMIDGTTAPMPSVRVMQREIADWRDRNRQLSLALSNPDDWKNRCRVAVGDMSGWVTRVNQLWEIDASPSDALLTDGRASLYVCVDVYTRRMMVLVTAVPRTSAVLLLIRRCIVAWGMPEAIKTDNGSDFVSREANRAYALLDVAHPTCAPYSPEQKPHVERAIGTLQHSLMPLLPGYTGHNVAQRQALRARESFAKRLGEAEADTFNVSLTRDDLQRLCDDWTAHWYHHQPHAGLGDRTPAEAAAGCAGMEARVADERQLDILLMPMAGTRVVGKKGIQVENADFYSHDLIPYIGTGERFEIRLDPEDMGRIWVYRPEPFQFVCIAENPERRGLDRAALAAEAKALQARWLAEEKKAIRANRTRFTAAALAQAALGLPPAPPPAAPAPPATVTALPTAALPRPGGGMVEAARAVAAAKPTPAAPPTEAERSAQADLARRMAAPATEAERPEDRWWRRASALNDRIAQGEQVSQDDLDWLESVHTAPWYQSRLRDLTRRRAFTIPVSDASDDA